MVEGEGGYRVKELNYRIMYAFTIKNASEQSRLVGDKSVFRVIVLLILRYI